MTQDRPICTSSPIDPAINSFPDSDLDMSIHHDESIPPYPPPMPPLDKLVQRNKTKIATNVVNTNAKKLALKRRQRKQTQDLNEGTPICVEEHQSKQTVKMWIPQLELSSSDREILLSPTAWLTDSIINAAQNLLKKACPCSARPTVS